MHRTEVRDDTRGSRVRGGVAALRYDDSDDGDDDDEDRGEDGDLLSGHDAHLIPPGAVGPPASRVRASDTAGVMDVRPNRAPRRTASKSVMALMCCAR